METTRERRKRKRKVLARSVKIFDSKTHRYQPAHTCNVSSTGAMLQVYGGTHLRIGDNIRMAVDWDESQAMFNNTELLPAVIVRASDEYDGYRDVAVQFAQAREMSLVA